MILFLLFGLQPEFGQALQGMGRWLVDLLMGSPCGQALCCVVGVLRRESAKEIGAGGMMDEVDMDAEPFADEVCMLTSFLRVYGHRHRTVISACGSTFTYK